MNIEVCLVPCIDRKFLGKDKGVNGGALEPGLFRLSLASRFCRCCKSSLPFFLKASSVSGSRSSLGWFSAELDWAVEGIVLGEGSWMPDTSASLSIIDSLSSVCKEK